MFRNKQVDDIIKENRKPVYTYNTKTIEKKEIDEDSITDGSFISKQDKFQKETKDSITKMENKLTKTMEDHQEFIHENYIKKKTFNYVVFSLIALNAFLMGVIVYLLYI